MDIHIQIKKAEVYASVFTQTNYHGAAQVHEAGTLKKHTFASEDDAQLMERSFRQGATNIAARLAAYVRHISRPMNDATVEPAEVLTICLDMPRTWSGALMTPVKEYLFNYLVNFVAAEWYKIARPELAEGYALQAESCLDEALSLLHKRAVPGRRGMYPFPGTSPIDPE